MNAINELNNALNGLTPLLHLTSRRNRSYDGGRGYPVVVVALNNNDYPIISEEAIRGYDIARGEYKWSETPVESALAADAPALVEIPTIPRNRRRASG